MRSTINLVSGAPAQCHTQARSTRQRLVQTLRAFGLSLGMVSLAGVSFGASLRLSPLGLDISAKNRAAALTLANTADEPLTVQLRVFKWMQSEGEDQLEPATDIVASPPAVTIPAGASYTLRIARPAASAVGSELAYRLLIDELPKPFDPSSSDQGVRMVLRTSIPVFVADTAATAHLAWTVWQDPSGIHAQVMNSGARHAKIAALTLTGADGAPIVFGAGLNGYVLAGSARRFDLPGNAPRLVPGASLVLTAKNDALDIRVPVSVASR
jgi:fimbrial chaperone protein